MLPPPTTTFPNHAHHHRHTQPPLLLLPPPFSFFLPCSPPLECHRHCMSLGLPLEALPPASLRRITPHYPSFPSSTLYSPLTAALLCFLEHHRPRHLWSRLATTDQPSASLLIVVKVVRPGFPTRGHPKEATFPRLTGSSSPFLAATGDPLSSPASQPPAEISSPPPFSTPVEPSLTFSELCPLYEVHTATVDNVLRLAGGRVVASFFSDHRQFTPPSSSRTTGNSRHPPLLVVTAKDQHPLLPLLFGHWQRVLLPDGNHPPSPLVTYL